MFLLLLSFIFFFQCSAHHRALHSFPTRRSSDLGHRMNNSLSDSGFIGTEFILDVDLIDRVEVIRGPASSLYGNNAFFGVVNVFTRKGRDTSGFGGELSGEAASFDSYKGRATYGRKFKNGR